jgi:AcrR family transcriptional regulator
MSRPSQRRAQPRAEAAGARERIIQAALVEFAARGFDGAATRQIAARAEVNQGLITYYFGDKEKLWKATMAWIFQQLIDSYTAKLTALEEVDDLTRLRLAIRHFIRFSAQRPELHRMMVHEGGVAGPRTRWLMRRFVAPMHAAMGQLIAAAQAAGASLPAIGRDELFWVLIGAGPHPFAMAAGIRELTGKDPTTKEAVEAWAAAIEVLLLGGRGAQRARP